VCVCVCVCVLCVCCVCVCLCDAYVVNRASLCAERSVYKSKGKSLIKSADQSLDERQQSLVARHYSIHHRRGQAKDLQARCEVAALAVLVL
jgi:hypothetical protein